MHSLMLFARAFRPTAATLFIDVSDDDTVTLMVGFLRWLPMSAYNDMSEVLSASDYTSQALSVFSLQCCKLLLSAVRTFAFLL